MYKKTLKGMKIKEKKTSNRILSDKDTYSTVLLQFVDITARKGLLCVAILMWKLRAYGLKLAQDLKTGCFNEINQYNEGVLGCCIVCVCTDDVSTPCSLINVLNRYCLCRTNDTDNTGNDASRIKKCSHFSQGGNDSPPTTFSHQYQLQNQTTRKFHDNQQFKDQIDYYGWSSASLKVVAPLVLVCPFFVKMMM